ncbi:G-type lectin S-receptor-like serine/threonine-protein kinase LECRK2 [Vicia villosa]|uniref:G-type lectin S-receptor-like serine/threonine-protein kinase LECRK2 n=1 Tax=Vicia villosa TaxID=3911 RepID=UPI00273BFD94|nr:G-type lectin S-receptor-like serine/threonine-protein kinase LECRK2 [Vicia villosa]
MASSLLLFLLCPLIFQSNSVVAQTKSTIAIGDSYTAETNISPWLLSPSGDFAFGFLPLNKTDLFLLSIWYAKISEKTVVWHANGDSPAPKGSKVELNANDGLVLTSPNGDRLWNTTQVLSGRVSRGVFNDTGNFVLQDSDFNSVWETFDFPRDTLLPSQVLDKGGKLRSKLKETDFRKGRFELHLQNDGDLVMYSINLPSDYANDNYYESQTVGSNTSSAGTQLVLDRSGDLYVLRENNEKFNMSGRNGEEDVSIKVSSTNFYLRATLNLDGVFSLFKHPKNSTGSEGWTTVWSHPENICRYTISAGSGVCGYNSFCTLGDDKRPTCQCPKSYSLIDPDDPYGSCKPDFIQGCAEDALSTKRNDLYYFENLTETDWPLSDAALLKPFTEELCMKACMEDCLCSVAIFRSGDSCWKKKLPLSNGRVDTTLDGAKAFLKVRKDKTSFDFSPNPIDGNKNNKETLVLIVSVLFGSSAILNGLLVVMICAGTSIFQYKKKPRRVSKSDTCVETNLRCFTYEELEEATNGFDKELGRGAFGIVYEGVINNNTSSETRVAVKKLNNFLLDQAHKEFRNEVNGIGLTHHKNLVRLLGFCEGGSERLLVYEYMSNGTLANFLFNGDDEKQKPSWKLRLEIAIGVARGLVYLHEECITRIIHCDIKPQNILLDDNFNARISDFGLAKLLNMNESKTNTGIRGTKGYVALEWFKNMTITAKVDVYSYGVVLLEIISCRRCVQEMEQEDEEKAILTDWAYDCHKDGVVDALVEGDSEALDDKEKLEKLVMIGLWCVQEDPYLRPTMRTVVHMLEGIVEVQVPPYPSQISIQYSLN